MDKEERNEVDVDTRKAFLRDFSCELIRRPITYTQQIVPPSVIYLPWPIMFVSGMIHISVNEAAHPAKNCMLQNGGKFETTKFVICCDIAQTSFRTYF